jgi:hypothetical protein
MAPLLSTPKWRLFFTVLPLVLVFGLAKTAAHALGWQPWQFNSLTGSLFGAATFVIAFLLGGTLGDYKTSAEVPVRIVNAIETIQDTNVMLANAKPDYDPVPLKQALGKVLEEIVGWLEKTKTIEEVEAALDCLNPYFAVMLNVGLPAVVNRVQAEQAQIRLLVHRVSVIRDTDFLKPAYALLEVFWVGAVTALFLIKDERFSENLVLSCLLFAAFTYLLLLIRDLDNPFNYDGKSSVDVNLSLLHQTLDRFQIPRAAQTDLAINAAREVLSEESSPELR